MDTSSHAQTDNAQVKIPPPFALLVSVLVGFGFHQLYPVQLFATEIGRFIGVPLIVIGFSTILYCAGLFKKAQTDIKPWMPTSRIITTGIYKLSRNPIYLSFVIVGIGIAFTANSFWILTMMAPLIFFLNQYVIKKEERYLEQKFGDEYRAYLKSVRRWI